MVVSGFSRAIMRIKLSGLTVSVSSLRECRPSGFRTMVILGYVCEGLSVALLAAFVFVEAYNGKVFDCITSFISLCVSVAAIVFIFLMAERKKVYALQVIRVFLWASIPFDFFSSVICVMEVSDAICLVAIPMTIVVGVPIALYWQQRSHYDYLCSYRSQGLG